MKEQLKGKEKVLCQHYEQNNNGGCTYLGGATGNCLRIPGKYPPCPLKDSGTKKLLREV